VVEQATNPIQKYPYRTPNYRIENGTTFIETALGEMPLEIFGKHNLQNLAGAKWICQHMGVDEADFYEAIASFKGASKRLEKIAENESTVVYKDFAHSPSKVEATTNAVKNQYAAKKLLACLELHTYSSLNAEFLKEYKGALNSADIAVVFYSPHAVEIKRLEKITEQQIRDAFEREDLVVYTDPKAFREFLFQQNLENTVVLLMSSGNYGGLDFDKLKAII
jgi:UDP-N-acetylmuramate: L-alanyl-gamma-D-glutamyl-meso-diaminopimelate ligase